MVKKATIVFAIITILFFQNLSVGYVNNSEEPNQTVFPGISSAYGHIKPELTTQESEHVVVYADIVSATFRIKSFDAAVNLFSNFRIFYQMYEPGHYPFLVQDHIDTVQGSLRPTDTQYELDGKSVSSDRVTAWDSNRINTLTENGRLEKFYTFLWSPLPEHERYVHPTCTPLQYLYIGLMGWQHNDNMPPDPTKSPVGTITDALVGEVESSARGSLEGEAIKEIFGEVIQKTVGKIKDGVNYPLTGIELLLGSNSDFGYGVKFVDLPPSRSLVTVKTNGPDGDVSAKFRITVEKPDSTVLDICPPGDSAAIDSAQDEKNDFKQASASDTQIPKWVDAMVEWWADGKTSDQEFVAGIEYLIKAGTIQSPKIAVADEKMIASAEIQNKNPQVPSWIKTNAKWYAEGKISAADFTSGLEFMVEQEIISSPTIKVVRKIPEEKAPMESLSLDSATYNVAYSAMIWNEVAMSKIVAIKDYKVQVLKDNSDKIWKEFAEVKDPRLMEKAVRTEQDLRLAQEETVTALKALKYIEENAKAIKAAAMDSGISVLDIEDAAKEPLKKLEESHTIRDAKDYKNAETEIKLAKSNAKNELIRINSNLDPSLIPPPPEMTTERLLDELCPDINTVSPKGWAMADEELKWKAFIECMREENLRIWSNKPASIDSAEYDPTTGLPKRDEIYIPVNKLIEFGIDVVEYFSESGPKVDVQEEDTTSKATKPPVPKEQTPPNELPTPPPPTDEPELEPVTAPAPSGYKAGYVEQFKIIPVQPNPNQVDIYTHLEVNFDPLTGELPQSLVTFVLEYTAPDNTVSLVTVTTDETGKTPITFLGHDFGCGASHSVRIIDYTVNEKGWWLDMEEGVGSFTISHSQPPCPVGN